MSRHQQPSAIRGAVLALPFSLVAWVLLVPTAAWAWRLLRG